MVRLTRHPLHLEFIERSRISESPYFISPIYVRNREVTSVMHIPTKFTKNPARMIPWFAVRSPSGVSMPIFKWWRMSSVMPTVSIAVPRKLILMPDLKDMKVMFL